MWPNQFKFSEFKERVSILSWCRVKDWLSRVNWYNRVKYEQCKNNSHFISYFLSFLLFFDYTFLMVVAGQHILYYFCHTAERRTYQYSAKLSWKYSALYILSSDCDCLTRGHFSNLLEVLWSSQTYFFSEPCPRFHADMILENLFSPQKIK